MAKQLVLFAAVVVALVALTAAEGEATGNDIFRHHRSGQLQCERELQESSLEACQKVVDQQLVGQLPWSTGLQMRCCQQLRDVSPECRPAAVSQVARQYEQQTAMPSKGGSFYPGGTAQPLQHQQGGWWGTSSRHIIQWYYPGQTSPQHSGQGQQGYYPSVTSSQRPGQEQQPGQGQQGSYPSATSPQQPGQGQQGYYPSATSMQQLGQGQQGYYPIATSPQQPGQGQQLGQGQQGYYPSATSLQQPGQGQQGWLPSRTSPQGPAQGAYQPSPSSPQQQAQGCKAFPQEQGLGSLYFPSGASTQQKPGQGYHPSETSPQQQGGGFHCGLTTQQPQGGQQPYDFRGQQTTVSPHQGRQSGEQPCGFRGQQTTVSPHRGQQSNELYYDSPCHVSAEQQAASLKVAKAQQLAAQLPAMCRLEGGGALSASQ
uniref:D-hordein Lmul 1.2 n=1 Tax=Leymus multicaulis TaxID=299427 RepID=A0A3G2LWY2_9POAL|nr:D-hordein Lmul 1.2 [Leymus multicaulis]